MATFQAYFHSLLALMKPYFKYNSFREKWCYIRKPQQRSVNKVILATKVERGRGKSWGKQLLSHYLQWWVEVHLKPQGKDHSVQPMDPMEQMRRVKLACKLDMSSLSP